MKFSWSRCVFAIAAVFSFRMLGLFMLIPVFSLYARDLEGATSVLIGIALGGYGLTQGLLQIPFGMLSDKIGRKPVLIFGLLLFALGSLLGALSHSIEGIIIARILQGTGAVGSVLIALLADLTPDHVRTKSMAVIGVSIGLSFALAMVISPPITRHFGLSGIFYFSFALALLGIALLLFVIPKPEQESFHADSETRLSLLPSVLKNPKLLSLDFGIFTQHFILTATFFEIPLILHQHSLAGLEFHQWHFYLPLVVFAFIVMVPFIILAEKKGRMKPIFIAAVTIVLLAQLALAFFSDSWLVFCSFMFLYFSAFNFLEASLPSLVSKQIGPQLRGTAMGVYSSSQFLGIFAGGALAGVNYHHFGSQGVFFGNALVAVVWLIVASLMKPQLKQIT